MTVVHWSITKKFECNDPRDVNNLSLSTAGTTAVKKFKVYIND